MHCPRCGQKQVSEEIKFCSRCGFPLGLVSELLSHGGFLPQLADLYKSKNFWTKKNGVMFSVFWFIFFTLIITPIMGIANIDELAGASAILGVFGGFMLLIASLVFLKNPIKEFPLQMNQLPKVTAQNLHGTNPNYLPPQQSIPVETYTQPKAGNWRDTNDLAHPGSVTDDTTKLLQKDK